MVSDTVLQRPLPEEIRTSVAAYVGCASGALRREDYLALLREAGFSEVGIVKDAPIEIAGFVHMLSPEDRDLARRADVVAAFEDNLSSITISAIKDPHPSR
jgi:hypothetical protein